jgi:hypothetical protein
MVRVLCIETMFIRFLKKASRPGGLPGLLAGLLVRFTAPAPAGPPGTTVRTGDQQARPDARQDCAVATSWDGSRAGMPADRASGPERSSVPQMTAPTAKMPAHHQNTVV